MKISIIIPAFNEKEYIEKVIDAVYKKKKEFNLEIIVSDDGSTDGTLEIIKKNKKIDKWITKKNEGKGSAIINALNIATGEIILIQDADLEYSPEDYKLLIDPFIYDSADVVYGSRFVGSSKKRVLYYKNRLANFFITHLSNFFTNLNFSDIECGFKVFKKEIIKKLQLKEKSFGFEVETTMKISKLKIKIFEVGVGYCGRTIEEGKKIGFLDGVIAIYLIFKFYFFK
jgi:glycosyltransferase involved in cell wall biosynthesis